MLISANSENPDEMLQDPAFNWEVYFFVDLDHI